VSRAATAAELVAEAIARLARKYPFYGAVLSRGEVRPEPVGTLAVTIRGNRLTFLYDPEFVRTTPADVLVGGLHHEVLHVVLGHLEADPSKSPDREARVVAEEVTCNEHIQEPLPPDVLRHHQFGLPDGEGTEVRYARLAATNPDPPTGNSVQDPGNSGRWCGGFGPRAGEAGTSVDANAAVARITAGVLLGAASTMSPRDLASLPSAIRGRLSSIVRAFGSIPPIEASIPEAVEARLPWRSLIEHLAPRLAEPERTLSRPSRRLPELAGVVPGSKRWGGEPTVLAVIDSSASVTVAMLAAISAELRALSRYARVVVCECDTEIRRTYRYREAIRTVVGRGGTDLRPPFSADYLRRSCVEAVVVFSDGMGPAPATPPSLPVLWVVLQPGRAPAAWGKVVCLRVEPHPAVA
jgi:predicted metal-dependent peptidase